jgi:hypothetical protein
MSSNKSWGYDCSVFRRLSAATRVSVFSLAYTDFRAFAGSHGFPCHTDFRIFVSLASSRRHTEIRVLQNHTAFRSIRNFVFSGTHGIPYRTDFRVFVFSASHGIPYHTAFRISVFSPSHEVPTACLSCGPPDDLEHAAPFAPCVASTLLVGICPSQLPCCRGAGASSAPFPSAWASVDSACLNHTFVHRHSPNDFLFPSRWRHPIDFRSHRLPPIQALPHPALPLSSALRRGLSALAALAPFSHLGRVSPSSSARRDGAILAHSKTAVTCQDQEAW